VQKVLPTIAVVAFLLVSQDASALNITNKSEITLTEYGLESTCDGADVRSSTVADFDLHTIIVDMRHWYLTPNNIQAGLHSDFANGSNINQVVAQDSFGATVSTVAESIHVSARHELIYCLPGGGIIEEVRTSGENEPC